MGNWRARKGRPQAMWGTEVRPEERVAEPDAALGGLNLSLASLATNKSTKRFHVDMHVLSHTFKDRALERAFLEFAAEPSRRRALQMWGFWTVLAALAALRSHVMHFKADEIVLVYALLGLCMASAGVAWRWPKWQGGAGQRLVVFDALMGLAGMVAAVLVFLTAAAGHRNAEARCARTDGHCLAEVNFVHSFREGLFFVAASLSFLVTLRRFLHFAAASAAVLCAYLVVFVGVEGRATDLACVVLMVVVQGGTLLLHRYNDRFERSQYLWSVGVVKLTRAHVAKITTEKEHKQRIVGYLFHEVRNPINDIVLATSLALDSTPPDQQQPRKASGPNDNAIANASNQDQGAVDSVPQLLSIVHQAANAASRVLDDALDMQKLEAGNFAFVRDTFALRDMYQPVVKGIRPRFGAKGVVLEVVEEEALCPLYIQGDIKRLHQVVHNFLSNALKFTAQKGRVQLAVGFAQGSERTSKESFVRVRVAVSDTGIGIRDADKPKMFTAWSQIRAAETQAGGGTGLGLALSKDFVEKGHNGQIGLESPGDLGCGTTFFFEIDFPTCSEPVPNAQSDLRRSSAAKEAQPRGDQPGAVDVLLVDDSAITRRLMGRVLANLGVSFEEAASGKEAVERMKAGQFRMVLMDKEMPEMDGYEATQAIRRFNGDVPIIGVTGNAMDHQRQEFLACGANRVLAKPVSKDNLVAVLRSAGILA